MQELAREMQAKLQVKYEPALAENVKEMQQNAIHLRHPGCRLANQTSNGVWVICFVQFKKPNCRANKLDAEVKQNGLQGIFGIKRTRPPRCVGDAFVPISQLLFSYTTLYDCTPRATDGNLPSNRHTHL